MLIRYARAIDTIGIYEDRLLRGAGGWRITDRWFRTIRAILSPSQSADGHRAKEAQTLSPSNR